MEQPVIVVSGGDDAGAGGDATTAFAAGAATVVAAQASEDAQEAQETAATAVSTADHARSEATQANVTASTLEGRLEALEDLVRGLVGVTAEVVEELIEGDGGAGPDTGEPPVVVDAVHVEAPASVVEDQAAKKKSKRSFGARSWFGDRA